MPENAPVLQAHVKELFIVTMVLLIHQSLWLLLATCLLLLAGMQVQLASRTCPVVAEATWEVGNPCCQCRMACEVDT